MTTGEASSLAPPGPRSLPAVRRLRFVAAAPAEATVIRRYQDPRPAWAIEEEAGDEAPSGTDAPPAGGEDRLILKLLPAATTPTRSSRERPDRRASAVVVQDGGESIGWSPGTSVVRCTRAVSDDLAAAVVDFAFLERELRALEAFLVDMEAQAQTDLPRAHRVEANDRTGWEALARMLERVTGARLTFARLEPQFLSRARDLSLVGRRWFSRLRRRAGISDRLEAVSDRLEALEDFYEAANQRIADYRWYREGHRLEKSIIGILVLECFLMIGEIIFHLVS